MKYILFAFFIFSHSLFALEIHGHRGARALYPENSLEGFDYAIKLGVDYLEFDLALSKDDIVVINHDPYINPQLCTHPKLKFKAKELYINKLSFKQIKEFECGLQHHPRFPKQKKIKTKIGSLKELLELIAKHPHPNAKKVKLNLETKIFPAKVKSTALPEHFTLQIAKLLVKYNMLRRSVLQSFDYRSLDFAKKKYPALKVAQLTADNLLPYAELYSKKQIDILSPNKDWITSAQIKKLQKKGIKVIPWTANSESDWQRLISMGVDGIITDDPAGLINKR